MRDILFRGKCVDNGELVVGNLIKTGSKTKHGDDGIFSESYISNVEDLNIITHLSRHKISTKMTVIQVFDETVSQYTGLKDKNGKMIFEGDKYYAQKLMRHPAREHSGTYWISVQCEVVFVNGMFDGKVLTDKVHYCELVFFPSGTMGGLPKEIEITGTIRDKQGE